MCTVSIDCGGLHKMAFGPLGNGCRSTEFRDWEERDQLGTKVENACQDGRAV